MILKENYEERHIRDLQAASKGDPGLIERTLYAFGLLEALAVVGLDFTFKGGTSLPLLLGKGFCFEARQRRILIDDEYFFIDLVFYNRVLHCNVIIELKDGL